MPIAAVPGYLGDNFEQASPGMRFGMYLKVWTVGQYQTDRSSRDALRAACDLGESGKALVAWHARQQALAEPLLAAGRLASLHARAVAPFATGLGNEHPTENGFAFLWPYGLPYLPGSGVKGVLRAAARELGWPEAERLALFGSDPPVNGGGDGSGVLQRGALSFWDVLPRLEGDRLWVDVMTPHQTHYYQPKDEPRDPRDRQEWLRKTAGSARPHDSGQPNPIHFLTVPPGSHFVFHVGCDPDRLPATLKEGNRWRERLGAAFEHAFEWLGFGAKTAVGYGAMARDKAAEQRATQEAVERAAQQKREAERSKMTAAQRMVDDYAERAQRRLALLKTKTKISEQDYGDAHKLAQAAAGADWTPQERNAAADAIEHWGPKLIALDLKDLRKRLGLAALRGAG
jgi:CRISPR-associated protein Cmr6